MGLACSSWMQLPQRGKVSSWPLRTGKTGWNKPAGGRMSTAAIPKYDPRDWSTGWLRDDLRMTDGVRAVLVDPRVKGSDIHVGYFLALPSHGMQGHGACSPPQKGLAGFQRGD